MNGGAVREERSPEKDAMDLRNALQEPRFCADTQVPSFSFEDIVVSRGGDCWLTGIVRGSLSHKARALAVCVLGSRLFCIDLRWAISDRYQEKSRKRNAIVTRRLARDV